MNKRTTNFIMKMYYKFDYFIFFSVQSEKRSPGRIDEWMWVWVGWKKASVDFGLVFPEISFIAFYFVVTHRIGLPCITSKLNKMFFFIEISIMPLYSYIIYLLWCLASLCNRLWAFFFSFRLFRLFFSSSSFQCVLSFLLLIDLYSFDVL